MVASAGREVAAVGLRVHPWDHTPKPQAPRPTGGPRRTLPARSEGQPMSRRPRRVFTREFKLELCRQLTRGETRIVTICREHGLCRSVVERWQEQYAASGEDSFRGSPDQVPDQPTEDLRAARHRIEQLEAALGRATLEVDLLRRAVGKGGSASRSGAS